MTNSMRYLEARFAIVKTEKQIVDKTYGNARAAQYDGHRVDISFMNALKDRRDELADELEHVAAQIRSLGGEEAENGARKGAQEASDVPRQ